MTQRAYIGWIYWHSQRNRNGWRQVGPQAHMVCDDFGNLVMFNG